MIRFKQKFSRLSRNLRHRVTLEKKILTADNGGGYSASWEQIAVLWAEIQRIKGGEGQIYGKVNASATHLFRLRYRSDITAEMRLCYDNRIFNIRAIHNSEERDRMLNIYAEEGVAV